jgi:hypothetical protein
MFLKFEPGFWVSSYRLRYSGELPPIEMRNQTRDRRAETDIPSDAPSFSRFPMRLYAKLIRARIEMLIGLWIGKFLNVRSHSITTSRAAIAALFPVINRYVTNLPPMPGVFPDCPVPVVDNDGGQREKVMMREEIPDGRARAGYLFRPC